MAALVVMHLTGPTSLAGSPPAGDYGWGAGHVLETDFVSSGHSGPNGENPVGTITLRGFLDFTATATCSNVAGNAVVSGYRIETGKRAGKGFISSAVDRGRARNGRPVDLVSYSGILPRPPLDCPSPGDPPPPGFESAGGGPFASGDFTIVDARERLAAGAGQARVTRFGVRRRRGALLLRLRVCGAPGTALLKFTQASSPIGRERPVSERGSWRGQLRQIAACTTHTVTHPLAGYPSGRRYRVAVRGRTTGRRWSAQVVRRLDVR